jgi:hypothetical protein
MGGSGHGIVKLEMVVPESDTGISFSKFLVSRHLSKLFYDELHSISTFHNDTTEILLKVALNTINRPTHSLA